MICGSCSNRRPLEPPHLISQRLVSPRGVDGPRRQRGLLGHARMRGAAMPAFYGADQADLYRQVGIYTGSILQGDADLPVVV
jgi:hypothetical protein